MKKSQFILAVTLLASGVAFAGTYEKMVVTPQPCGPWYVSAYGGGSFYDDAQFVAAPGSDGLNSGWIIGGAVGLRTDKAWRFELDLNQAHSSFDALRGEIERTSLMVNAVKELNALQFLGLTPYLGAGIGLTNVNDTFGGFEQTVLGYQFMGGLVYDLTDCLQAFAEYRLQGQGNADDVGYDLGWAQHVILGVRWFF
jgi:opacity protein-like surface antigen